MASLHTQELASHARDERVGGMAHMALSKNSITPPMRKKPPVSFVRPSASAALLLLVKTYRRSRTQHQSL